MSKSPDQLRAELEALIDQTSLSTVLGCLAEVAIEKAEHLRVNWQDHESARCWDRAATACQRAQTRTVVEGV